MPDPLSKSQIEQLGRRLVREDAPAAEDLASLQRLLLVRSEVLDRVVANVRGQLGVAPTSRIKNTGTILEKLRRNGGSGLKSMQDLAGMRIVGRFDRGRQDELVARIVELFAGEKRAPKVVDRRVAPMHGYSAVHVIVFPEGIPAEIQVRTEWQHEWAELFEKLADLVGRGIRYGESVAQQRGAESLVSAGPAERVRSLALRDLHQSIVDLALSVAQLIRSAEEAEVEIPGAELPRTLRGDVDEALDRLRALLGRLARLG